MHARGLFPSCTRSARSLQPAHSFEYTQRLDMAALQQPHTPLSCSAREADDRQGDTRTGNQIDQLAQFTYRKCIALVFASAAVFSSAQLGRGYPRCDHVCRMN